MRIRSATTLALLAAVALPGSAAAASPRVEVMVFGKARLLAAPRFVRAVPRP